MDIRVTIDLPAPPNEVWDYLRDVTRHSEWRLDAAKVEVTSTILEGPGLTFDCLTSVGPFRLRDRIEVLEWEPGHLMAVQHSGVVNGFGQFTLLSNAGGTRFCWEESIRLPWHFGGKLGERVAKPILVGIWKRNLRGLRRRIIERQDAGLGLEPGGLISMGSEWELRHYGPDHIVRTNTGSSSLSQEAEALEVVGSTGFPVPKLVERLGSSSIVMERLDGPTMLQDLTSRPWTLGRHAKNLARLHLALGKIVAPSHWERVSDGDSVVHLDFHPGNIKLSSRGPVVLNWSRATRGSSTFDAAVTYVILRTGVSNEGRVARLVLRPLRKRFANVFLKEFGASELLPRVREAAEFRLLDAHLSPHEREAVFALARDELD